jgi:YD repeat-containing protein
MKAFFSTLFRLVLVGAAVGLAAACLWYAHGRTRPIPPWKFAYDLDGRMSVVVDPAGRTTRLRYDSGQDRRLRGIENELPDHTRVALELDPLERLSTATDSAGVVRYRHDGFTAATTCRP